MHLVLEIWVYDMLWHWAGGTWFLFYWSWISKCIFLVLWKVFVTVSKLRSYVAKFRQGCGMATTPPPPSPLLCQQFLSYWDHFIIHIHFHCRETDLNANFFVVWSIYIIWLLYKFKILTFIQISQYPIFKDYGAWTGSNIKTSWLSWLKSKCPQITFF